MMMLMWMLMWLMLLLLLLMMMMVMVIITLRCHRTWLAGKSLNSTGIERTFSSNYMFFFSVAMFEYQRMLLNVIDMRVIQYPSIEYSIAVLDGIPGPTRRSSSQWGF